MTKRPNHIPLYRVPAGMLTVGDELLAIVRAKTGASDYSLNGVVTTAHEAENDQGELGTRVLTVRSVRPTESSEPVVTEGFVSDDDRVFMVAVSFRG